MRQELFQSDGSKVPETTTKNEAGGVAYSRTAKEELAQLAVTCTFGDSFYISGREQLETLVKGLLPQVDSKYIAQLALYSRDSGYMKDMPAMFCATLATRSGLAFTRADSARLGLKTVTDEKMVESLQRQFVQAMDEGKENSELLSKVFPRVINNGRMLRNFVQIIRSGVLGRKSLGSGPKRLVKEWIQVRRPETLFRAAVGNNPSLADVIKMVRPFPATKEQDALYAYLIGKEHSFADLPPLIQEYECFKNDTSRPVPNVEFRYLTGLELSDTVWKEIAKNARWQMTRMNLNTFARHAIFTDPEMVRMIADRLRDSELVRKANQFPYQMLTAYRAIEHNTDIPNSIKSALQDAVDLSMANVPNFSDKNIVLCPDTSGSMSSAVIPRDRESIRRVRDWSTIPQCIDVAGLVTSAFLRTNPEARVMPFAHSLHSVSLNPRDTLTTNTDKLKRLGGGGTACQLPLAKLNQEKAKADLVIYISDNQSWIGSGYGGTEVMKEWKKFQSRNKKAQMVCIDVTPSRSVQAPSKEDQILNIGGFSDVVFDLVRLFVDGNMSKDQWVSVIESTEI